MEGFARIAAVRAAKHSVDKTVCLFKEPGDVGMNLVYAWFQSGVVLRQHSHNADCLYYVLGGSLQDGKADAS